MHPKSKVNQIYSYNIPFNVLFLVIYEQNVILEAGRNQTGILVCTVKAIEWLSVTLRIGNKTNGKIIGIFDNNLTIENPNTVDLFTPVFNRVASDEVTVSLNTALENINRSLCSTKEEFSCSVTSKYGSDQNGSMIFITGKKNTNIQYLKRLLNI